MSLAALQKQTLWLLKSVALVSVTVYFAQKFLDNADDSEKKRRKKQRGENDDVYFVEDGDEEDPAVEKGEDGEEQEPEEEEAGEEVDEEDEGRGQSKKRARYTPAGGASGTNGTAGFGAQTRRPRPPSGARTSSSRAPPRGGLVGQYQPFADRRVSPSSSDSAIQAPRHQWDSPPPQEDLEQRVQQHMAGSPVCSSPGTPVTPGDQLFFKMLDSYRMLSTASPAASGGSAPGSAARPPSMSASQSEPYLSPQRGVPVAEYWGGSPH